MTVTDYEIASITQDVWRAFVGLEVEGPVPNDEAFTRSTDCGASIDIDGPFRGRVVLGCSPLLASEAAALVYEVAPERVDREMVGEVLAELANQIGGNLKSLLPQGCHLSLPKKMSGSADPTDAERLEAAAAAGSPAHCLVSFERDGQRFDVALLSRS
jgi:chemotaxis protein CheX